MELTHLLYLDDILYTISSALLAPVVVLLIAFIVYSLWCIGSVVVEALTERRNFTVEMPPFLAALSAAPASLVPEAIADSGLLNRQKAALLVLWDHRCLRADTYVALAKRLLANEDLRYKRIVGRTDAASKIAPMIGLMGTLIPLGPGIVALGQGDTTTLSQSLGIAFNTTVCGLVTAVVCLAVSKVRRNWYENYLVSLESAMTAVLEIVADMREGEGVDICEPGSSLAAMGFERERAHLKAIEDAVSQQRVAGLAPEAEPDSGAMPDEGGPDEEGGDARDHAIKHGSARLVAAFGQRR